MTKTKVETRSGEEFERLLNLDEVAEVLGVSYRTAKRMVHEGELPSVKLRRRRRVKPEALRDYWDSLDV